MGKKSKNRRQLPRVGRDPRPLPERRDASRGIFPFLDLPAELRNVVYSLAFRDCPHNLSCDHHVCPAAGFSEPVATAGVQPRTLEGHPQTAREFKEAMEQTPAPLLTTCRQLDFEASPFLFHTMIMPTYRLLQKLLFRLPATKVALIRHIHIGTPALQKSIYFTILGDNLHILRNNMPHIKCIWVDARASKEEAVRRGCHAEGTVLRVMERNWWANQAGLDDLDAFCQIYRRTRGRYA